MTKSDFENLIKSLSVEQMIGMMPMSIKLDNHEYNINLSATAYRHNNDVYYNVYYARVCHMYGGVEEEITLEYGDDENNSEALFSERKREDTLKRMLLWLFDNNFLENYKKDDK